MPGIITLPKTAEIRNISKVAKLTVADYVKGVLSGDRMLLARAITIVESNSPKHYDIRQEIIQQILPYTGSSIRVGITGVPGAGKSTFVENLGCRLCKQGRRVAVLAVDPSSTVSKGSILGDKTRMENLSREKNAFIRPSPSAGTLGGVAAKSRETILLCEAAGYDTILVETVGVGQGETTVRSMVDFFLVLVITGAGDELQGIKKGVIELADAIVVNKADGDNLQKARVTQADYNQILRYLRPATEGWFTKAYCCSALTGEGIEAVWKVIERYVDSMKASCNLQKRRLQQDWEWVQQMLQEYVRLMVFQNPVISDYMTGLRQQLGNGSITAAAAARSLAAITEEALKK
ncbi:MAG: methylmalonyl Co-A mutase-associated GTPase MeaB [Geobacteraceae bacterium]|nr:methylmalonyl Co-A mutase-associated GTPase MeaB [Geobacteraceae bacterium]